MCYLILHASRVGYVRYRNTAHLAVHSRITPNRNFMRTYCIYICYLILHGSRVSYARYRNTAYLAVPLVSFLTDILCIHIGVHILYIYIYIYIYMLFDRLNHCYVA
jgi:hypothetical protein